MKGKVSFVVLVALNFRKCSKRRLLANPVNIFLYKYSGFCHKSDKSNERKVAFDFVGMCVCMCVCVVLLGFCFFNPNCKC